MEVYRSARQFGVSVILLTMLFRIFEAGLPHRFLPPAESSDMDIQIEKETGRPVRSFYVDGLFPLPTLPEPEPEAEPPVFVPEDADSLKFVNTGEKEPDLGSLLVSELSWDLASGEPTVLILHTHTTESYTKDGEDYPETADYRTLEETRNMLSIGERVAQLLEDAGIVTIHDRTLHDYPNYTGAYNHARKSIQAERKEHPSIRLVLDLHRDAAESQGKQMRTSVRIGNQESAKLMFVIGCGNAGLKHPSWEENLALALKLQILLERQDPGICRPLSLRPQRFNQDLCTGSLLVEVGTAGNTHAEAMLAAEELAKAIISLKNGAK